MTARQDRSMMTSLPAVATMLLGVVLLVLAALRWRDNGWGALVWLAVFVAMCAIRAPHSLRNRANVVVEARKDATEIALLVAMFMTMMVLPLLHLATGVFTVADYALPDAATWIGALAQIPFLWLFWRSHADLGPRLDSKVAEVRKAASAATSA